MVALLTKARSGIDGFDELLLGGLPRGQTILVTGGTGTGKSTFAMQFVYKGAKVYDEPGIYVTMEEKIPSVIRNAASYGWDLEELQKKEKLALIDLSPAVAGQVRKIDVSDIYSTIYAHWKRIGAKRVAIDPITVLGLQTESPIQLRTDLIRFSSMLKELDATFLYVTEIPEDSAGLSRFGIEEFISDGVIVLYYSKVGGLRFRGVEVRKMRGTSHKEGIYGMKMSEGGLAVVANAKVPKLA